MRDSRSKGPHGLDPHLIGEIPLESLILAQ